MRVLEQCRLIRHAHRADVLQHRLHQQRRWLNMHAATGERRKLPCKRVSHIRIAKRSCEQMQALPCRSAIRCLVRKVIDSSAERVKLCRSLQFRPRQQPSSQPEATPVTPQNRNRLCHGNTPAPTTRQRGAASIGMSRGMVDPQRAIELGSKQGSCVVQHGRNRVLRGGGFPQDIVGPPHERLKAALQAMGVRQGF